MRYTKTLIVMGALAVLVAATASAATLEEVVAKHVAARGGDAWKSIDTLKITGDFTAFSVVAPFSLTKKRGGMYLFDHVQNGRKVIIGSDGREIWWDNAWFGGGARAVEGPDLPVHSRETDFVTPFFDYAARGFELELIGPTEIDEIPAIAVKVKRPDGGDETWYLDPGTYLEVARVSPGSDFGRPMPQTTFFDDFRKVGGVTIPFFSETQWYTRDRVMRITNVETNVAIDDAIFRMPAPPGMGELANLVGSWKVAIQTRQQPGAPWVDSAATSKIERRLRGTILEESAETEGSAVVRVYSYDKYQEKYRVMSANDATAYMDIETGKFDENGRLVVSNVETGTTWSGFGMTFHNRISIFDITPDGFKTEQETSIDGGENWFVAAKATYTRAPESEE